MTVGNELKPHRKTLEALFDLARRQGAYQFLVLSSVLQKPKLWAKALRKQRQKPVPEGRVFDKFAKDPHRKKSILNLLVKGYEDYTSGISKWQRHQVLQGLCENCTEFTKYMALSQFCF